MQLRIQNPNNFELGIYGIRFNIDLNDREFGNGRSAAKVTVLRLGSEEVTTEVIAGFESVLRQIQGMNASAVKLRSHLKGTVFAESPGNFTIPFDKSGEVDLNFGPAAQE